MGTAAGATGHDQNEAREQMRKFFPKLRMWVFVLATFVFPFSLATAETADDTSKIRHMAPAQVLEFLRTRPDAKVLDVRFGFEFRRGHVTGATNLNYLSLSFKRRLKQLNKNRTWVVHCKSGHRSGPAVRVMEELGFKSIIHMEGGFDAWKQAGLPIAR